MYTRDKTTKSKINKNEDGTNEKRETTKRTSAIKEGVGGTDIVKIKPIKVRKERKGVIVKRPREKASMREEKIEYEDPTREKRSGEERA